MDKYIKCDCCGEKICFGDEVYYFDGYCGTYCSAECFASVYGNQEILDEDLAENNMCKVYDIELIAKRKSEIELEIQKLQNELKSLED